MVMAQDRIAGEPDLATLSTTRDSLSISPE
jgi:hypothetical protein